MSAVRRFMAVEGENNVLQFTIDTTKIVQGATNGSENPLTFKLGLDYPTNSGHLFIIRVDDGRSDVAYSPSLQNYIIHFTTPGIYKISLIGKSSFFTTLSVVDKLKVISLDRWAQTFRGLSTFQGYKNMVVRFKETMKITGDKRSFFSNIKGFDPEFNMNRIDVSEVTNFTGFFSGIELPLYSSLNPYINQANVFSLVYQDVDLTNVSGIEIISPTLTTFNYTFQRSNFSGEIIIKAPIVSLYGAFNGVLHSLNLGKIDVRVATNFGGGWIGKALTRDHVDATLLGWVNNFDWSSTPVIARTVSLGTTAKYSNDPAVISAKSFLESKGFTFSNLTMA